MGLLEGFPLWYGMDVEQTPDFTWDLTGEFSSSAVSFDVDNLVLGATTDPYVPTYYWWGGCSPTSGGMLVGWWYQQPEYDYLWSCDLSTWDPDDISDPLNPTGIAAMIASAEHIAQGIDEGYTYEDDGAGWWEGHDPNCMADFLHTELGGTSGSDIAPGLEAFTHWDNPATTDLNEWYPADAYLEYTEWWEEGSDDFQMSDLAGDIDANHPMLINLMTYYGAYGGWIGHTIAVYGYLDNPGLTDDWMAVRDTWSDGLFAAPAGSYIDGDGIEWWPYDLLDGSSYDNTWDWEVTGGVYYHVYPQPEPGTLVLLALGLPGIAWWRRRKGTK